MYSIERGPGGAVGAPRLILEVLALRGEPRRFLLAAGASARVGRTTLSDFVVADDEQMSGAHFLIEWDGAAAAVTDLGSATGTLVGGAQVAAGTVRHGGWIRAGTTDFRVHREGHSLIESGADISLSPFLRALHRRLAGGDGLLYAVLDAARSPRIVELLKESADEHQSLFEGLAGAGLWRVAPYLVKLEPDTSPLLARLLAEGWGHAWGIYVQSGAPFKQVRRHFRRHLRVEDPESRSLYFRFYDPRVLRRFLPMASGRQSHELFAEVGCYVVEGKLPGEVLTFTRPAAAAEMR